MELEFFSALCLHSTFWISNIMNMWKVTCKRTHAKNLKKITNIVFTIHLLCAAIYFNLSFNCDIHCYFATEPGFEYIFNSEDLLPIYLLAAVPPHACGGKTPDNTIRLNTVDQLMARTHSHAHIHWRNIRLDNTITGTTNSLNLSLNVCCCPFTTPFRPQSNARKERVHRYIHEKKNILKRKILFAFSYLKRV